MLHIKKFSEKIFLKLIKFNNLFVNQFEMIKIFYLLTTAVHV